MPLKKYSGKRAWKKQFRIKGKDWTGVYIPDHESMGDFLKTSPPVRSILVRKMRKVNRTFRAIAPYDTGELANSGKVSVGLSDDGSRMSVRLTATAPHAAANEWGNRGPITPDARKPLRRALRAAGG